MRLFAFSPKAKTKQTVWEGERHLTKVAFPVQSKNLDVETNRKLTEQKYINEDPKSMGLKVCLDILTRYLYGIPMYFLFWKNQRENSFWLLRSGVRLTFFLSFFLFFFNSRLNTNMNTAKHQMFKVVSCWSSLQKLFSQLHLGGGCPCSFLATPSHIYIYIFFF